MISRAAMAASSMRVSVTGWTACPYFAKAKTALLGIGALHADVAVEVVEHADRDAFRAWWFAKRDVS